MLNCGLRVANQFTAPVQMKPVADNVNGHTKLEEEHVLLVKYRQHHKQTHGGCTVCQLVQHRSKLRS